MMTGRGHGERPATHSFFIAFAIAFIDFLVAASGAADLVVELTAIALVAVIIAGRARAPRAAPTMILVGVDYLALATIVIGWVGILAVVAMMVTGAVALTFGAAIIGPRTMVTRARHLAERATKAHRT